MIPLFYFRLSTLIPVTQTTLTFGRVIVCTIMATVLPSIMISLMGTPIDTSIRTIVTTKTPLRQNNYFFFLFHLLTSFNIFVIYCYLLTVSQIALFYIKSYRKNTNIVLVSFRQIQCNLICWYDNRKIHLLQSTIFFKNLPYIKQISL